MLVPPSPLRRTRELLLPRDVARLAARASRFRTLPRGDGAPILLVPGFGATDRSLSPLRRFLRGLGHDARPIELGRITDEVEELFPQVGERALDVAAATGRRTTLIGWSIGGFLAREAARDHPDAIAAVVTIGTPVVGGPSYTALAGRYSEARLVEIRARIDAREASPITVPILAFWSANDGIVNPDSCIDRRSPRVEHVRVSGTHLGMGLDPDVWSAIAVRLSTFDLGPPRG